MRRAAASRATSLGALPFVLGIGTVTWSISEPVFWARLTGEGNDPGDAALTWTLYCGVTYLALVVLRHFRVAGPAGIFLVGALLGWLVEGAVVPEAYTSLPISVVWTSLAWHALLTVCAGWWLLPAALRRGSGRAWIVCAGAGLAWGLWSLDPGLDEDVPTLSGPGFAVLALGVTIALAGGYWLIHRYPPAPGALAPGRPTIIVTVAVGAWATAATFVPVPFALPLLLALLGLATWALRRLRPPRPSLGAAVPVGVPLGRLVPLVVLALTAITTNVALGGMDVHLPAVVVAFSVLTATGTAMLAWSLRRALRAPAARACMS